MLKKHAHNVNCVYRLNWAFLVDIRIPMIFVKVGNPYLPQPIEILVNQRTRCLEIFKIMLEKVYNVNLI